MESDQSGVSDVDSPLEAGCRGQRRGALESIPWGGGLSTSPYLLGSPDIIPVSVAMEPEDGDVDLWWGSCENVSIALASLKQ